MRKNEDILFSTEREPAPTPPSTYQPENSLSVQAQFTSLPADWAKLAYPFVASPASTQLCNWIEKMRSDGAMIYPSQIFYALHLTAVDKVKVVILGQDPYHGIDRNTGDPQAHGLAFSVPVGAKPPPSLRNIFKELQRDLGLAIPLHGSLETWAKQGVLLLNTILTVTAEQAASHARLFSNGGWEAFTDQLLSNLAQYHAARGRRLIVMLWGSHARAKAALFADHVVLEAAHPSPLSAHRGFLGCGHFGLANHALIAAGQEPINWRLPENAVRTL